jgi:creatinine amidohydrolase
MTGPPDRAEPVRWAAVAAPRLRELADGGAIAVWPVGATEQHGPHLRTGFDLLAATAVCEEACRRCRVPTVLLPGLALGASDHWLPLGATLSLRATTLIAVAEDVARSVHAAGFRRLVIVNGHMGNVGPLIACLAAAPVATEVVSYWTFAADPELVARFRRDDGGVGHAGEFETSLALAYGWVADPARVEEAVGYPLDGGPGSRVTAAARAPRPLEEAPNGVYGDGSVADAELGRMLFEAAVDGVARHLEGGAR